MIKLIKNFTRIFVKICVILLLLLFLILLLILKNNQGVCEAWTRGFSRFYQSTLGYVFKYIPFSLTEWLVIGAVICAVILLTLSIISFIKLRICKGINGICSILIIALSVVTMYFATAEMAYNREALPIQLYEENVHKSKFRSIIDFYVDDMNKCVSQMSFKASGDVDLKMNTLELAKQVEKEYERLKDNPYYTSFTTYVKPMAFSWLFSEFQLTGVTFLPATEANINYMMTDSEKPFTALHEVAHSKGVMREEDANMLASYLCLTSDNPYFRYSGYMYTIGSLLDLANYTGVKDEYAAVYYTLPKAFLKNIECTSKFWNEHKSMQKIADWFNDLYLKMSGEKDGTKSYQDTPIEVDPTTREITAFSNYQKLYFQLYYSL